MDKSICNKDGRIEVTCSFGEKLGIQRNVRFYCDNALEYVKKEFPDLEIEVDESCRSLIISNYREPLTGTWIFYIKDDSGKIYKDMADKFEENRLKVDEKSVKVPKKTTSKKSKENETINDKRELSLEPNGDS